MCTTTKPKKVLGRLFLLAPIIVISCILSICLPLYEIQEKSIVQRNDAGQYIHTCTESKYLLLIYGVCSRGKSVGINIKKSCLQWTNVADWNILDKENKIAAETSPYYHESNTAEEAKKKWPDFVKLSITSVAFSTFNLFTSFYLTDESLDCVAEFIDTDKWIILVIGADNVVIVYALISLVVFTDGSDMTDPKTWTSDTCQCRCLRSVGYFACALGALLAAASCFIAGAGLLRCYLLPLESDLAGEVRLTAVAPTPSEGRGRERGGRGGRYGDGSGNKSDDEDDPRRDQRAAGRSAALARLPLARPTTPPHDLGCKRQSPLLSESEHLATAAEEVTLIPVGPSSSLSRRTLSNSVSPAELTDAGSSCPAASTRLSAVCPKPPEPEEGCVALIVSDERTALWLDPSRTADSSLC